MIVFRCNKYRIPPDYSREKFILHTLPSPWHCRAAI